MKKNYLIVGLVLMTFFVISFLTNIIGPLVPDIISDFEISQTLAGMLISSFFIAYGIMSIPAGILVEKWGEKTVMMVAFTIAGISAFLFALSPTYIVYALSLFIIGCCMAMLQVAINPLLRVTGGEEQFAFNSVLGQLFFGLASFLSPLVYSYLVRNAANGDAPDLLNKLYALLPEGLPWISLYWLFGLIAVIMTAVIGTAKFPTVTLQEDERVGALKTHLDLLKNPITILYFLSVFAYVGTEQGVANWISQFLLTYHQYDPQTVGASTVSWFWGLMTAGTLLGLVLLKFVDSRKVLIGFSAAAIVSLTVALLASGPVAIRAFPMVGFFASVMWSVIISLALNSVKSHHGSLSGILITGIAGGAVIPLIVGWLGDQVGLRTGMFFLYITLLYILSIGFWAKPLINNKTVGASSAEH
ncbi:MAG: MFS transporter [Cyclobacteriaceae bacterium]|nr:MAG: MFS transporter [Cyclobacteriaceae bacterium]